MADSKDKNQGAAKMPNLDVISETEGSTSQTIHFPINFQNNTTYNLSDLPPLDQLDKCSPEVRKFVMEQIESESKFRHKHISKLEDNRYSENQSALKATQKLKITSIICAALILAGCLGWSLVLVLNGEKLIAIAPVLTAIGFVILGAVYGKSPPSDDDESDGHDSAQESEA